MPVSNGLALSNEDSQVRALTFRQEARADIHRVVAVGGGTHRGVTVAEAGRASELIRRRQVEVARLALVALPALHIRLAGALSRGRRAERSVVEGAGRLATAVLAAADAEVVEADFATVAELATDTGLAAALTVGIALAGDGADVAALARRAVVLTRTAPVVRDTLLAVSSLKG